MKAKIICRTTAKRVHTFYLVVDKQEYYLFRQNYRKSNREFFLNGKMLTEVLSGNIHGYATHKTIEKLLPAIRYIEKEYNIAVLDKTKRKDDRKYQAYRHKKLEGSDYDEATA